MLVMARLVFGWLLLWMMMRSRLSVGAIRAFYSDVLAFKFQVCLSLSFQRKVEFKSEYLLMDGFKCCIYLFVSCE